MKNLIFVGRIEELKGIKILLKAWKIIHSRDLKLKIYGQGPESEWCEEFIADNQLSNIQLCGVIPHDRVYEEISNSAALIMPTKCFEGFPMTIAEAYAMGTPVVGSDIGNVNDLIIEGVNGIHFTYNSPSSLANTLDELGSHTFDRRLIKEIYDEKYSASVSYRDLMSIYDVISKEK